MRAASVRAGLPTRRPISRGSSLTSPGPPRRARTLAPPLAPAPIEELAGLPGERALLSALVGSAVARENALIMSLADPADSGRHARASSSLRRLRRSGVLIRAALRDR